nr:TM2 domain-containing protein [uncultured Flavobacterium sp.]
MDANKVDDFLFSHGKYFDPINYSYIKKKLLEADDSSYYRILSENYQDPTILLIASIFIGNLGIDRMIIGDIAIGLAKLFTCGGLGVWYIIDIFLIMRATRDKNMEKLMRRL